MEVYLDYNASAPIDSRVLDSMVDVYKNVPGNADSRTHNHGYKAQGVVENARKQVADLLKVLPEEVFFTSGATESNNIAIQGLIDYAMKTNKKHIISSSIEHKAILETLKAMEKKGFEVDFVNPDLSGRISVEEVINKIRSDTLLVSIMHVNNETGIIQPVKELGEYFKDKEILFHVDATQSCGKLVRELQELNYNMLSFSAHKLRGPQGIGALILRRESYKFPPVQNIMYGGQQENGLRPGTIPVALVAGCGTACELSRKEFKKNDEKTSQIKNMLLKMLLDEKVDYHINGDQNYCVSTTVNICFPGVVSEALMLCAKSYCSISNGSACTSKSYSPSYVLTAMGVPLDEIESSVRISWGSDTDVNEIKNSFKELLEIVKQIKG